MYKCIVFDMDGTLVDTFQGIVGAYRRSFAAIGREFPGEDFVRRAIGAPLPQVFKTMCGMNQEETAEAVRIYRAYYDESGKDEAAVYEGMQEALRTLKAARIFLGVATLKHQAFAEDILRKHALFSLFDAVYGMDRDDRLTKAELIRRCMQAADAAQKETVLVGDSPYDAAGAREAGVEFLAVTYGFGFSDTEKARTTGAAWIADAPRDIPNLLGLQETVTES